MSHPKHLTATMSVDQRPDEVFAAINDVRGWWSENVIGETAALGDQFVFTEYTHDGGTDDGIRYCRFRITELVPGERVVWHVVDSYLNFVEDHDEWTGTDVIFEIGASTRGTTVEFTHKGLTADGSECFEACSRGWTFYVTSSLPQLITTGTGQPIAKAA